MSLHPLATLLLGGLALTLDSPARAPAAEPDLPAVCADRAAIERVYYHHRLGDKPPFAQAMPPALLERLVKENLHKEAALQKVYGVEVTPAMLAAEVQRINTTTRAPDMLAELKAALGNDPARFAQTVARPIIVERLLRERFDNDDKLHATQRRQAEQARSELLAAKQAAAESRSSRGHEAHSPNSRPGTRNSELDQRLLTSAAASNLVARLVTLLQRSHSNEVSETTWQLGARPAEKPGAEGPDAAEIRRRFGPEAQILSSPPGGGKEQKSYFEDLPGELQRVLRVQLRQPGDVSAVIEMPTGFLVYLAKVKTADELQVAVLAVRKRSYETWLEDLRKEMHEP